MSSMCTYRRSCGSADILQSKHEYSSTERQNLRCCSLCGKLYFMYYAFDSLLNSHTAVIREKRKGGCRTARLLAHWLFKLSDLGGSSVVEPINQVFSEDKRTTLKKSTQSPSTPLLLWHHPAEKYCFPLHPKSSKTRLEPRTLEHFLENGYT